MIFPNPHRTVAFPMARMVLVSLYDEHCHGLRLLTARLKAAGHQADIICFKQYTQRPVEKVHEVWDECHVQVLPDGDYVNSYSYPATEREEELFLELITRLDPQLVGFGFTATQQRPAMRMASLARERLGTPVMFGGPHPTTSPEWSLDHADYVCRGEADDAILDIAAALDGDGDLRSIANICWRDGDGQVVENAPRPLILDLDRLPFPDHSDNNYYIDHDQVRQGTPFPESELNKTYLVMTARGCQFHCSFCYNSFMQGLYPNLPKVRERSIDNVMEELRQAKARRNGHFYLEILDSVFTLKPERVREFCEKYHRDINLPFWGYTHPMCAREETIAPLGECPNCEYLIMGIQSASNDIGIKTFHRVQTNEAILEAAQVIHRAGVKAFYDIITNVPGETEEMCRANLDLLRQLPKPWRLRLSKISLFPEYQIRRDTGEKKYVTSRRYRLWNALYFLVQDADLTDEQVDAILADPLFEERPEMLEAINRVFERRFRDLDDTRARLRIAEAMRDDAWRLLGDRERQLADIRWRKGFKYFLKLSDFLRRLWPDRAVVVAGEGGGQGPQGAPCPPPAPQAPRQGEHLAGTLSLARPSDKSGDRE